MYSLGLVYMLVLYSIVGFNVSIFVHRVYAVW